MAELTDEEVLALLEKEKAKRAAEIAQARENLAKYGTVLPPVKSPGDDAPIVTRVAPVPAGKGKSRNKHEPSAKWFKITKKCAKCGKTKNVGKEFGVIVHTRNGEPKEFANSWCRSCRSKYRTEQRHAKAAAKK